MRLGTDEEGWNAQRAERELAKVMALIAAGKWSPPARARAAIDEAMTLHEFASLYMQRRWFEWGENTRADYSWRLSSHILPFLREHQISEIDDDVFDEFRRHLVTGAHAAREALDAGQPLRDASGRPVRPLSANSINKILSFLAAVLDWAVERDLLTRNPARGKGKRLKVKEPVRTFVEPDELHAMLEASRRPRWGRLALAYAIGGDPHAARPGDDPRADCAARRAEPGHGALPPAQRTTEEERQAAPSGARRDGGGGTAGIGGVQRRRA